MNKLIVLEIAPPYDAAGDFIYPVVLCDDNHCVLVDTGYVGTLPTIEEVLYCHGVSPEAITHIILTHQDHDHVGTAAAFKQKYPDVLIMASIDEAPYISGFRKSLRLEQAEQLQKTLLAEQQAFGEAFCSLLRSVEPVEIDYLLKENEILPFCGGCQVIATPGHTPGHISLYLPEFDTIISGDAIALAQGQPVLANPQFTLDIKKAEASMQRLLSHSAQTIICYHGGLFKKEKV